MARKIFTRAEIEAMLASMQHNVNGFIGIWAAAEGRKAVRLAEQVKDACLTDVRRLLQGVPTLHDHIRHHLNPDHGDLPVCGQKPECRNATNCEGCQIYEEYKNKLRDNFRS